MRSTVTNVLSVVLGVLAGLGISTVISAIIPMKHYWTYLDVFFAVPIVLMVWLATISAKQNKVQTALLGVSVLIGSLLYLSLLKGVQMW